MTTVTWPTWVAWLIGLAILLTLFLVWSMVQQVGGLRRQVLAATSRGPGEIRSRRELEEAYTAGRINREAYERLREHLT